VTRPNGPSFDDHTTRRFARLPALRAFAEQVESRLSDEGPEGIWACRRALEELVLSGFVRDLFRAELEELVRVPSYMPSGAGDTMTIARSHRFALLLKASRPEREVPPSQVFSLSEHYLLAVAGPSPFLVDLFAETPGYANDVFDRERPLGAPERRTVLPGEVAEFRAGRDCVRATHAEATSFALQLVSRPVRSVQWVYSAESLRAIRAQAADATASRLEFAAHALAELRGEGAAEGLARLCDHPDHFVRWSAIRGLTRVDLRAGLEKVRAAVADPHPHVRNAAARTLRKMESDGVLPAAPRQSPAATVEGGTR
jgi:hypothetical protein